MSSNEHDERLAKEYNNILIKNVDDLGTWAKNIASSLDTVTFWVEEAARVLSCAIEYIEKKEDGDRGLAEVLKMINEQLDNAGRGKIDTIMGRRVATVFDELHKDKDAMAVIELSGLFDRTLPRQKEIGDEECRQRKQVRGIQHIATRRGIETETAPLSSIREFINFDNIRHYIGKQK